MSEIQIRRADKQDATQVRAVIQSVWPENIPDIQRIQSVIKDEQHVTLVSGCDGQIAGFVDGFMTVMVDGRRRWEVDLLAVMPQFQRRGIASALVEACTQAAQTMGAAFARGLVAVGNTGSEKAFARCGYVTDEIANELVVAGRADKTLPPEPMDIIPYLIPVQTMNYAGLWVEGQRTRLGLQAALSRLSATTLDVAGAVIPADEKALIADALVLGFERSGRYRWWQRLLTRAS
ncbi:MAG: GNAT family N-acetyltransferase [Chloroflexi bacterium]|nr:GNAT family N-acetyltransferase [Chloroflexota bacterium]